MLLNSKKKSFKYAYRIPRLYTEKIPTLAYSVITVKTINNLCESP